MLFRSEHDDCLACTVLGHECMLAGTANPAMTEDYATWKALLAQEERQAEEALAEQKAQEAERVKQERKDAKARAMAKLTDEDKILLGLKKR